MSSLNTFSGSYLPGDVEFLLTPREITMTPVAQKEALIQSGQKHYSDMLSEEPAPTQWHLDLFSQALADGAPRLAIEVAQLATVLADHFADRPVVLVSLVRAGVPLGVMLHQALRDMGKISFHYGISVIRDRGIDTVALAMIESRHGTRNTVFVDGWTGKGAIADELARTLQHRQGYPQWLRLVVLADPCGCAWLAASADDWLIPFGIMGAPVSGLISRSVWSADSLHGCVICHHLSEFECSRMLVDTVAHWRRRQNRLPHTAQRIVDEPQAHRRQESRDLITNLAKQFAVDNPNRIKPGIAEATRAVLRRVPQHVLVRDISDPDVALLIWLAHQKEITITEAGNQLRQYRAVTIIRKVI